MEEWQLADKKNDEIKENFNSVKKQIAEAAQRCGRNPDEITLVAVSKKKSVDAIVKAIDVGVEILGENYIQEAVNKIEVIHTKSPSWHFIGHLQSNKAKVAVKYFDLIHTVDSLKLAKEINRHAEKAGKIQDILIQINISQEETKSGAAAEEGVKLAEAVSRLKFLSLKGVMGMPPFFDDPERARPYLRRLANIREAIKRENIEKISMEHLSMGMSDDFRIAIEEGSTMVRIGTAIFGSR
ncbi:MAG: YggS family pyridoxal phosphate-dependent enzyme [Desulfamplus sp.]|nr:YggS family pyridoxal phosphate-dependent enzyme [Desulfamplus sp.]